MYSPDPIECYTEIMSHSRHSTIYTLPFLSLLALLLLPGCASSRSDTAANPKSKADAARLQANVDKGKTDADKAKDKADKDKEPKVLVKVRPLCPIRLGGVVLRGLGDSPDPQEDSASAGTKLSDANREWLAANCDVAALNTVNLQPDTFRKIIGEPSPLHAPDLRVCVLAVRAGRAPGQRGRLAIRHDRLDIARCERRGNAAPRQGRTLDGLRQ